MKERCNSKAWWRAEYIQRLKISLQKWFNYEGTNDNLTVEKLHGHHLYQDANKTDDHQVATVRT